MIYSQSISTKELLENNINITNSHIDEGVVLHRGVIISDSRVLGGSTIEEDTIMYRCDINNSRIGKSCNVDNAKISDSCLGAGVQMGPWAHIRNNTHIGDGCRIGNFVEIKKSSLGTGTKVAHLTYIGDAEVGRLCNFGCGVVVCNYDGKHKHKTIIGDEVFIGSNVNLIAPIIINNGAFLAAGSTINKDVSANTLAIARTRQECKQDFCNKYTENLKNK